MEFTIRGWQETDQIHIIIDREMDIIPRAWTSSRGHGHHPAGMDIDREMEIALMTPTGATEAFVKGLC